MDGSIILLALTALVGLGIVAALRVLQGAWRVGLIVAVIILSIACLWWYNVYTGAAPLL